jgi:hypothetical protein
LIVAQSRVPVARIIYFCAFSTMFMALALMTYAGLFDGLGDALVDIIKPIAKFFFQ